MQSLQFKSELLRTLREYFYQSGLIEVITPVLRRYGASDPHLDSFAVPDEGYLQTSPEHAMKCLLAEHQCSLFQICPAFRRGEKGARHLPEFLMLEWYQCGFTLEALMDDVAALMAFLVQKWVDDPVIRKRLTPPVRTSYRALFEQYFSCNPHEMDVTSLRELAMTHGVQNHLDDAAQTSDYLDALFSSVIEPMLKSPTIVYDFPACQAALAIIGTSPDGDTVSRRFELYIDGLELANAYQELQDGEELKARFDDNNRIRRVMGKSQMPGDEELLAGINKMPACAGIALGVDRLMMVMLNRQSIA